eukprot:TRINITY_DN9774_c0_g1_i1.p1 TRINITY_DN9774_c0_g1~~TRINITY_DN9774_c0_g1_i1.p1  ORF type:complete len:247 (-),score=50.01 TRINITY_DN9774_c0_g1_i1:60-800(-)
MKSTQSKKEQQEIINGVWKIVKQHQEFQENFQHQYEIARKLFQTHHGKKRTFSATKITNFCQPPSPSSSHETLSKRTSAIPRDESVQITVSSADVDGVQAKVGFFWFRFFLPELRFVEFEKAILGDPVLKSIFQSCTLKSKLAAAAHEEFVSLRGISPPRKEKRPRLQEAADEVKEIVETIYSSIIDGITRSASVPRMQVDEASSVILDGPAIQKLRTEIAHLNSCLQGYADQLNHRIIDLRSHAS